MQIKYRCLRTTIMLVTSLGVSSCFHNVVKPDPLDVVPFDQAMATLVDGLNELSRKDKNFGMLADEINVAFTLKQSDKNEFGVALNAKASTTATTKVESYTIEKSGSTGENSTTTGSESSASGADKSGSKTSSTDKAGGSSKDTQSGSSEGKIGFNNDVTSVIGGDFNAHYSSVESADGSNLINIKFKNLANYPTDKTRLLARYGRVGCVAFFVETLGEKINDKGAVDALLKIVDEDSRFDCDSSVITEVDAPDTTGDTGGSQPK